MSLDTYKTGPVCISKKVVITTWINDTGRDVMAIMTSQASNLSRESSRPTWTLRHLTADGAPIGDSDIFTQSQSAVGDNSIACYSYRTESRPLGPVLVASGESLQLLCIGLEGDTSVYFAGTIIDTQEASSSTRDVPGERENPPYAIVGKYLHAGTVKIMNQHINIAGNAIGNAFGHGSRVTNNDSFNYCDDPVAAERELATLKTQIKELQAKLPADKADEIARHAAKLDEAVKSNNSERRHWYTISAKGLLEASAWVKDFTGNIAGTIRNLGKAIWTDFTLPG